MMIAADLVGLFISLNMFLATTVAHILVSLKALHSQVHLLMHQGYSEISWKYLSNVHIEVHYFELKNFTALPNY